MGNLSDRRVINCILRNSSNRRSFQIKDVHSKVARNYLRGIDPVSYGSVKKALEKIKLNCSLSDYRSSLLYVRTNPLIEDNDFGQLFNSKCPKSIKGVVFHPATEISTEFYKYENELSTLTLIAISISECLEKNDLSSALDFCDSLVDKKGVSIYLLRVISYITNRFQLLNLEDNDILGRIDRLKISIDISKSPFITDLISQLSNLRTPHLIVGRRIKELNSEFKFGYIAKFFISPNPKSEKYIFRTLSSFYEYSLFDAYLYLATLISQGIFSNNPKFIPDELLNTFERFASHSFNPENMYVEEDNDNNYYFMRECFLFSEQHLAYKYSAIHGHYYSNYNNQKNVPFHTKLWINEYFKDVKNVDDLRCEPIKHPSLNWSKYNSSNCDLLENSTALIHLLTKKEGRLEPSEQLRFVELMSFTRDIGDTCDPEYLENIANSAESNLLKLVSQCLITINKKTQYTEHALRSTIQEYCIDEFDGNLLKLLQSLYLVSPAVTEHFIIICNETFLSTLFHLMDRPVDAMLVRAEMLNWFGEITGDHRYIDRAKTLRIDIQINKEKGTIDDSRIYVDPLKFTQWFEDKMVSKLTMALDNLIISNSSIMKLDWNSKTNGIGAGDEVIELLLSCYREFCENKVFGIASYLGRRIRHGTFKGTAISDLTKLPKVDEYTHLFEDKDFERKFSDWMIQYEAMIEDLVNTSLQIKSKRKTQGLITTEIDSPVKTSLAKQLVLDILSNYSSRNGVLRLPSLIIEYCWRLVEYDLAKIKKVLSEKKSSNAVFSYLPKNNGYNSRRAFSKFTQEVNSLTGQKFALMASWFNKPSYASPNTDIYLLFNAVIAEVKDSVHNFEPIVDLSERSLTINGGAYYVIYDVLYVLIHNSARHGKHDGKIQFIVERLLDRNAIQINIMSEVLDIDCLTYATTQIQNALRESDEDAHIVEGKSGIKKLRKLENEGSISGLKFFANEEELLICFEFKFELNTRGVYDDFDN